MRNHPSNPGWNPRAEGAKADIVADRQRLLKKIKRKNAFALVAAQLGLLVVVLLVVFGIGLLVALILAAIDFLRSN